MASAWKILQSDGPALYGLLSKLTLRGDAADDLLQELFLKLCLSSGFKKAAEPGAYARRMAINLAMDWRRRRQRQARIVPITEDPLDRKSGPGRIAEDADEIEKILDAAGRLGELPREAFVLRYIWGESYARVGEILGKTPHQARGLCHAAVKQVREILVPSEVTHECAE